MVEYEPLPSRISDRIVGQSYLYKGEVRIWDGKKLRCEHGHIRAYCKDCGGSQICQHKKVRQQCKECGGNQICEHGKQRSICRECGGGAICEHDRIKSCCKDCGGSQICEHGKLKSGCKECGGSRICEHGKFRPQCKECGGSRICEHGINKPHCKECGGSAYCEHGIQKTRCKECGGSSICEHNRERYTCKKCLGGGICKHFKIRNVCMSCNPSAAIAHSLRTRLRRAIAGKGNKSSLAKLLGSSLDECRKYLEDQFEDGMTWGNHGDWHIDHRQPCASFDLVDEEQQRICFHHTNLQPMWAAENRSKSDSFDEDAFTWEWTGEKWEPID